MTSLPFKDLPPSKTVEAELFNEYWPVFWAGWPHKVDKQEAMSLFLKALKITSPEEIIDGRDRYKAHKPDWQSWMSPAKFIRRRRWEDEYDTAPPKPNDDAIWRDKAAAMKLMTGYKHPRQDVEEAFRRGLLTEAEKNEAMP